MIRVRCLLLWLRISPALNGCEYQSFTSSVLNLERSLGYGNWYKQWLTNWVIQLIRTIYCLYLGVPVRLPRTKSVSSNLTRFIGVTWTWKSHRPHYMSTFFLQFMGSIFIFPSLFYNFNFSIDFVSSTLFFVSEISVSLVTKLSLGRKPTDTLEPLQQIGESHR